MPTNNTERLPTREEIAKDSMDGAYAIQHFYGKTLAEAEETFIQGCRDHIPLTYTEDLWSMEPVGFRFYIQAAIRVALSEHATGQSDFINGLAGAISNWHTCHPEELTPHARLISDFCRKAVEQFERFDADPETYPGLCERYQQLSDHFRRTADAFGPTPVSHQVRSS